MTDPRLDVLQDPEGSARAIRALLHEIRATVAGIRSALAVLRMSGQVSPAEQQLLESMVDQEVGRLERLVNAETQPGLCPLQLDQALAPVVHSHQVRGSSVHWAPSGVEAVGRPDDVAEVVNILLSNATDHGAGPTTLTVVEAEESVEIHVCDTGPGIDDRVRERIFEWGVRGPDSAGQGIGLHVAQQLMTQQRGYLRIGEPEVGAGARFVIGLPRPRPPSEP